MSPQRQSVDYVRAHRAVAHLRGKASGHVCVDCGKTAEHWTYDYSDPEPLYSVAGSPYSHDAERYTPRCVSCHLVHDRKMDPGMEAAIARRAQRAAEGMKHRLAEPGGRDVFIAAGYRVAALRRECECGKVCAPGPMKNHQKATGHEMKG